MVILPGGGYGGLAPHEGNGYAEWLVTNGISCFVVKYRLGAHVGTRLLNSHAVHLAAALPQVDYACELGEFTRMYDDPFRGLDVVDGQIAVPNAPGCGVTPVAGPGQGAASNAA